MELDRPFHLKITQEDGPRLNDVPLTGAFSKNGTWVVAIPMDQVEFEVNWTSPAVAALSAAQVPLHIPADRPETTEPEQAAAVREEESAQIPAQGRFTVPSPELKPVTDPKLAAQSAPARVPPAPVRFTAPAIEPEPAAEPKPTVGLPSDEEVAGLNEISSAADIAESYGVSEEEVKEAIRRAVKARVPIATATASQPETKVPEGMDPERWAELEVTPVARLNIHANAVASLHSDGVDTVAQLLGKSPRQLGRIPGVGPTYVTGIRSALTELGLKLPEDALELQDVTKVRRSLGGLKTSGIETVDQLCDLTRSQLAGIEGVGAKEAGNIAVALTLHGRQLKAEKK